MGLFDIFKKKDSAKNTVGASVADSAPKNDSFAIDKIDYYYDEAFEAYCKSRSISGTALTDAQMHEVNLCAGNHIGLFITWLVKHDLLSDEHKRNFGYENVKAGEMTGAEYLLMNCDAKLWSEDVKEPIPLFVKTYYERNYYQEYCNWVVSELHDLPMEVICTKEDYNSFEHILDEAYERFCEAYGY